MYICISQFISLIKDKTIFGIWIIVQQVLNGYIAEYRRWLPWQQLIDLLKSKKVIQFNLIQFNSLIVSTVDIQTLLWQGISKTQNLNKEYNFHFSFEL